ncbi:AAA domain-containing protein [Ditylenchus destructor]|uniref:AAA domain-containing protein n=1 Tax=Ditylenchus destructor TaxID=166010 RepID=A0AAD4NB79_9BILA|nr:AAA domain-containing protein [Ditylenchus destructor]
MSQTSSPTHTSASNQSNSPPNDQFYQTLSKLKTMLNTLTQDSAERLPNLNPPPYDGSTSFRNYLKQFNLHATAMRWRPGRCCQILPLFLKGEALALYSSLSSDQKKDWEGLCNTLAEKLAPLDTVDRSRRLLSARQQRVGESVTEFIQAIRSLVEAAYPTSKGYTATQQEAEAISRFRDGLLPTLRHYVLRQETPDTLDGVWKLARKEEQLQKTELERHTRNSDPRSSSVTLEKVREEQKKVRELTLIYDALHNGIWPNDPAEKSRLEELCSRHVLRNGTIYFHDPDDESSVPRLVIPYSLRDTLIREYHADSLHGAHLGIEKTLTKLRSPLSIAPVNIFSDCSSYLQETAQAIRTAWETVAENIVKAGNIQRDFADDIRRAVPHNIKVNDLVLLYQTQPPKKTAHKFRQPWQGPYRVVSVKPPNATIKEIRELGKVIVVHLNKLKPYNECATLPLRSHDTPLPVTDADPSVEEQIEDPVGPIDQPSVQQEPEDTITHPQISNEPELFGNRYPKRTRQQPTRYEDYVISRINMVSTSSFNSVTIKIGNCTPKNTQHPQIFVFAIVMDVSRPAKRPRKIPVCMNCGRSHHIRSECRCPCRFCGLHFHELPGDGCYRDHWHSRDEPLSPLPPPVEEKFNLSGYAKRCTSYVNEIYNEEKKLEFEKLPELEVSFEEVGLRLRPVIRFSLSAFQGDKTLFAKTHSLISITLRTKITEDNLSYARRDFLCFVSLTGDIVLLRLSNNWPIGLGKEPKVVTGIEVRKSLEHGRYELLLSNLEKWRSSSGRWRVPETTQWILPEGLSYILGQKPNNSIRDSRHEVEEFTRLAESLHFNQRQIEAGKIALENSVSVTQGPPGTGKTYVTALLALVVARSLPPGQLVLCTAVTNVAVDNLARQVLSYISKLDIIDSWRTRKGKQYVFSDRILRFYPKFFDLSDISPELRPFAHVNRQYIREDIRLIFTTVAKAGSHKFQAKYRPAAIFIDEASILHPLALLGSFSNSVSEDPKYPPTSVRRLIVVGDESQLQAMVHPAVHQKFSSVANSVQGILRNFLPQQAQTMLNVSYRGPAELFGFAFDRFYTEPISCMPPVQTVLPPPFSQHRLWLLPMENSEAQFEADPAVTSEYLGGTLVNFEEAAATIEILKFLMFHSVPPADIVVLSMYAGQRRLLKAKLTEEFPEVVQGLEVHTVDSFQGSQSPIVIICLVRNHADSLGFLQDSNASISKVRGNPRLNVALTRARRGLFVLGHRINFGSFPAHGSFGEDHTLQALYQFCEGQNSVLPYSRWLETLQEDTVKSVIDDVLKQLSVDSSLEPHTPAVLYNNEEKMSKDLLENDMPEEQLDAVL